MFDTLLHIFAMLCLNRGREFSAQLLRALFEIELSVSVRGEAFLSVDANLKCSAAAVG